VSRFSFEVLKREEIQWKVSTITVTSMSTSTLILIHMNTPTTRLHTLTNTNMSMSTSTSIPAQTMLKHTSTNIRGNTARTVTRTNRKNWNPTSTRTSRKPE
jgi:hypothetical protein